MFGCITCSPVDRTEECFEQLFGAFLFYGINRDANVTRAIPLSIYQRHPLTRGNVTLASADFNDPPIVHDGWSTNYEDLSSDARHDLESLVDAAEDLVINIVRSTSILEFLGHPLSDKSSGSFPVEVIEALARNKAAYSGFDNELDQCAFSDYFIGDDICTNWDECTPTIPSLPINDRELLRDLVFKSFVSSYHMADTCQVDAVVDKGSLAVKGVGAGLYISDLSILPRSVDMHSMMTAMSLGLLMGDSIDAVPTGGEYEIFPIALALICVTTVIMLLTVWIISVCQSKWYKKIGREDTITRRPSLTNIWGNSNEKKDMPSTLMTWESVSCSYEQGREKQPIHTLFNSFGSLKEGEVTAILGPSGASKSTLLDILSGRKSVGNIGE